MLIGMGMSGGAKGDAGQLSFSTSLPADIYEGQIIDITLQGAGGLPPYTFEFVDENGNPAILPFQLEVVDQTRLAGSVLWE